MCVDICKLWFVARYYYNLGLNWFLPLPLNLVLRKQVRRMVSAVLQVSQGRMTPHDIQKLIEFPAHICLSYQVVPAHGLYLVKVSYDDAVLAIDWTRKPASEKHLLLLQVLHQVKQSLQTRIVTNKS